MSNSTRRRYWNLHYPLKLQPTWSHPFPRPQSTANLAAVSSNCQTTRRIRPLISVFHQAPQHSCTRWRRVNPALWAITSQRSRPCHQHATRPWNTCSRLSHSKSHSTAPRTSQPSSSQTSSLARPRQAPPEATLLWSWLRGRTTPEIWQGQK